MEINSRAIYNTKPLVPYTSGKFCFTQSKDEKTKYIFYLVDEKEQIPSTIQLPSDFIINHKEIEILGYNKKLKISENNTKKIIKLPKEIINKSEHHEALVFVIE